MLSLLIFFLTYYIIQALSIFKYNIKVNWILKEFYYYFFMNCFELPVEAEKYMKEIAAILYHLGLH